MRSCLFFLFLFLLQCIRWSAVLANEGTEYIWVLRDMWHVLTTKFHHGTSNESSSFDFLLLLFSKIAGEPGTRRTLTVGPSSSSLVADTICPGGPAWGCSLRCCQWVCPGRGWRSPRIPRRPRRPPGGYSQQSRSPTPGRWSPRRPRGVRWSTACCRAAAPPAGCPPPSATAPTVAALGWSLGGGGGTARFQSLHSIVWDQFSCVTLYHLDTLNTFVCARHSQKIFFSAWNLYKNTHIGFLDILLHWNMI